MAGKRNTWYPGRYKPVSSEYPQGGFKNLTAPDANDGGYLEEKWLSDWDGFFGALLTNAGITPNGNVDTALNSQYYDSLLRVIADTSPKTTVFQTTGTSTTGVMSQKAVTDMSQKAITDLYNQMKAATHSKIGFVEHCPTDTIPQDVFFGCKYVRMTGPISPTKQPKLYAIYGASFPNSDGKFLRNTGGNGGNVQSMRNDAMRKITGRLDATLSWGDGFGSFRKVNTNGTFGASSTSSAYFTQGSLALDSSLEHPHNTANEVRPTDWAMNFVCISDWIE